MENSLSSVLSSYNSFLRVNIKFPSMRCTFIDIHEYCSYNEEPSFHMYIISVNITLFWNQKCSIGNIYFLQNR